MERDLSLLSHPKYFVTDDTAMLIQDRKPRPGVAPVAMQEGMYAAFSIVQQVTGKGVKSPELAYVLTL